MSWNIAILAIKGTSSEIEDIIPDVYENSHNILVFEEAIDTSIDRSLSVTVKNDWVIIIDVLGRFVDRENFPLSISKRRATRLFWVADEPKFRAYEGGEKIASKESKAEVMAYMKEKQLSPINDKGKDIILQLMDYELFDAQNENPEQALERCKFELYELDMD